MTKDEQRVAIAEACGKFDDSPERFDDYPDVESYLSCRRAAIEALPDYLNDLNAIHEAEKMLDDSEWHRYATLIGRNDTKTLLHASSEWKAECLLRTLNLWRDET